MKSPISQLPVIGDLGFFGHDFLGETLSADLGLLRKVTSRAPPESKGCNCSSQKVDSLTSGFSQSVSVFCLPFYFTVSII